MDLLPHALSDLKFYRGQFLLVLLNTAYGFRIIALGDSEIKFIEKKIALVVQVCQLEQDK